MVGSDRPHNFGWVTARMGGGTVVGFVNVVTTEATTRS